MHSPHGVGPGGIPLGWALGPNSAKPAPLTSLTISPYTLVVRCASNDFPQTPSRLFSPTCCRDVPSITVPFFYNSVPNITTANVTLNLWTLGNIYLVSREFNHKP